MGTWWNENWRIVNGVSCRECVEFSPEERIPYKRERERERVAVPGMKIEKSAKLTWISDYKHTHSHLFIYLFTTKH